MNERAGPLLIVGDSTACFPPIERARVQGASLAGLALRKDDSGHPVRRCRVPAFSVAGAISLLPPRRR